VGEHRGASTLPLRPLAVAPVVHSGGGESSAAMVVEKVKRSLSEEGKRNDVRLREGGAWSSS
jgi:hypothetical protein